MTSRALLAHDGARTGSMTSLPCASVSKQLTSKQNRAVLSIRTMRKISKSKRGLLKQCEIERFTGYEEEG